MKSESQDETITLAPEVVTALVKMLEITDVLLANVEDVEKAEYLREVATALRLEIEVQR